MTSRTWDACAGVLPRARDLAGSFAVAGGPNCFGTVMAAAGVPGAAEAYMLQEPFDAWLASASQPGGRDDQPGTVLVWRDRDELPVHAAVAIGDGWAFEKPSGEWWTPRVVVRVTDVVRSRRTRGHRLERHHILG